MKWFREIDDHLREQVPMIVRWLMYICVAAFLVDFLLPRSLSLSWWLAAVPSQIVRGHIYQMVTYAFLHGNFMHLLFNLMGLWFFGSRLEWRWGPERFARFALVCIVGSALTYVAGSYALPRSGVNVGMIGISGLVFGTLFVAAKYDPNDSIYLFPFPVPIPLRIYALFLGVITLISIPRAGDSIAHLGHLGGIIFGLLYVKYPHTFDRIPLPGLARGGRRAKVHEGGRGRWRTL